MTRRPAFLAIAALAAACGGEDGSSREPPPEIPVFAGLESVTLIPGEVDQVDLRWSRATDDVTPPEKLRYELLVYRNRTGPDSMPLKYDVSDRVDGTYRWGNLTYGNVHWFAVTVVDEDGNEAGGDRILPAVWPCPPPQIAKVEPSPLEAGAEVTITGEYLLDEPVLPDAVTIGGQIVPVDQLWWSSRQVRFFVPRTLSGEGRITVATPFGRAEAPQTLVIDPPGPVGEH